MNYIEFCNIWQYGELSNKSWEELKKLEKEHEMNDVSRLLHDIEPCLEWCCRSGRLLREDKTDIEDHAMTWARFMGKPGEIFEFYGYAFKLYERTPDLEIPTEDHLYLLYDEKSENGNYYEKTRDIEDLRYLRVRVEGYEKIYSNLRVKYDDKLWDLSNTTVKEIEDYIKEDYKNKNLAEEDERDDR